jgi:hypothetical protein
VRGTGDPTPIKRLPESVSYLSNVQERKQFIQDLVRGGMETQTSTMVLLNCVEISPSELLELLTTFSTAPSLCG